MRKNSVRDDLDLSLGSCADHLAVASDIALPTYDGHTRATWERGERTSCFVSNERSLNCLLFPSAFKMQWGCSKRHQARRSMSTPSDTINTYTRGEERYSVLQIISSGSRGSAIEHGLVEWMAPCRRMLCAVSVTIKLRLLITALLTRSILLPESFPPARRTLVDGVREQVFWRNGKCCIG